VARIRPSSATQSVAELGSHFPPEGRGACTPDAGRGNLRATREYPSAKEKIHCHPIGCLFCLAAARTLRTFAMQREAL